MGDSCPDHVERRPRTSSTAPNTASAHQASFRAFRASQTLNESTVRTVRSGATKKATSGASTRVNMTTEKPTMTAMVAGVE